MNSNKILLAIGALCVLGLGYSLYVSMDAKHTAQIPEATPNYTTISGTFECLPHANSTGTHTDECVFGIKSDTGVHYAVTMGTSTPAVTFTEGQHVSVRGYLVNKAALDQDHWGQFTMDGLFTISGVATSSASSAKLNIDLVCKGALAYMTFSNQASADTFVAECVAGNHPEVIERYKEQLNLGDGAQI